MRRRRRQRRRDLPARVRRRQDFAILAIVALVIGGIYFAFAGGGDDDPFEDVPVEQLVGQTVVGKVGKGGPSRDVLQRVARGELGGVIVEPRNERSAGRCQA